MTSTRNPETMTADERRTEIASILASGLLRRIHQLRASPPDARQRDHVHLLVSSPPGLSVSQMMQYIKGKSSSVLQREFPELKKRYGASTCGRGAISASRRAR